MSEPMKFEGEIQWKKKSKKVGMLLERLAEVVEIESQRRAEERLDEAFNEGYALALAEVQKFGLAYLLKNPARAGE